MSETSKRSSLILILSASSFLVFFQTYLFAPILASIAHEFSSSVHEAGWLIPAFMIPYGCAALLYGSLSDRHGRMVILLTLVALTAICVWGSATAASLHALIAWRVCGGLATGGIIPTAIALTGDLYSYKERGRPLGWIYSGMAGGAAFGATLGAYLNPIVGWRWELVAVGACNAVIFALLFGMRRTVEANLNPEATLSKTFRAYATLLRSERGRSAYIYVLLNSAFHSGVFSWLGLYFGKRYGLDDRGVGLALLGYGIPGMLFGPIIGKWVDRSGRARILPFGLFVGAVASFLLAWHGSQLWSTVFAATLSLGYDLTQPLLGGLITSLDSKRRGQAISLSAFCLFVGFGVGPLIFETIHDADFTRPLIAFGLGEMLLFILGIFIFRNETARSQSGSNH